MKEEDAPIHLVAQINNILHWVFFAKLICTSGISIFTIPMYFMRTNFTVPTIQLANSEYEGASRVVQLRRLSWWNNGKAFFEPILQGE